MNYNAPFFVFDVESVGLHGEAFAVGGGVYIDGAAQSEFRFYTPLQLARGSEDDRVWVQNNVALMDVTHGTLEAFREAFWGKWIEAKRQYPGILMAGECVWPVEANFVSSCIAANLSERNWEGPYPLHDISSIMAAVGMDPMAKYERWPTELPAHEPLADARQSARLLALALRKASQMRVALNSDGMTQFLKALQFDPFAGDFGEPGDRVISDKIVKCRGAYVCSNCGGVISKGDITRTRTDRISGDFMSWRWCQECTHIMALGDDEAYEKRIGLHYAGGAES